VTDWHRKTTAETLEQFGTDANRGLSSDRVESLRAEFGTNELVETGGRSPWRIVLEQASGTLVVMLVIAAAVSAFLHEYTDAIVILAIVILNGVLGFVQDYRAERALAALKKFAVPLVRVRRDGATRELSAVDLVPGDILLLEVGNKVPADARLIECVNVKAQEAALTGESEAVEKQTGPVEGDHLPLGDRTNMVYMGTAVTYGHGQAVITAIGMETELGQIAQSLQTVETEPTPLQKRLAQLGRALALAAVVIVGLVFVMGLLRGEEARLMLLTAMSMAVAVVPEGLPAVATVTLAVGARRMFKRNALIRKLPAVETLGSVTVICSDKTGTLTQNRMTVTLLDVAGERVEVPDGSSSAQDVEQHVKENSSLPLLLAAAALCNDAELEFDEAKQEYRSLGDPTEAALEMVAARFGLPKDQLLKRYPRVAEVPFDSERKRMTTVHRRETAGEGPESKTFAALQTVVARLSGEHIAFTKGAADSLLEACGQHWEAGEAKSLDDSARQRIVAANEDLAAGGMRVLGAAFRLLGEVPTGDNVANVEHDLIFIGMLGLVDPPRPEAREAVARCRSAGIRPLMITGDHPLTARHIAGQLGIAENDQVVTGQELERTTAEDLKQIVEESSVYARVAPKHKLQIVQALQSNGQVVAMTGDGVNDAPALRQSHIGVAMGITGTDVSKEASQMVLLDDNFATIVGAVEEGRIVYDNIRKFVKYTLTSNAGEIWVMVLGPLLGMPLPLLPLQILWINLVTDGLPGLALAVEGPESDTMKRPPYPPGESMMGRGMAVDILWIGLLMGVVSLAQGYWYWAAESGTREHWRTIVFTVLTISQMGNVMAIRSSRDSLFQIGVFSNRALVGAVLLTFGLQLAVVYWPPLQRIFQTTALTAVELLLAVAVGSIVFWAVEARKLYVRRRDAVRPA
jgi:P-type Ca2+ transporter type 2C